MRVKIGSGLLPLNLFGIPLIISIVIFHSDILRIVIGVPFLLFFPGYVLVLAIFPRRGNLDGN